MDRKSKVEPLLDDLLIVDPDERARIEERNGLLQFDAGVEMIQAALSSGESLSLRTSTLCKLNWHATRDVRRYAGILRPFGVTIIGSVHAPPPAHDVPGLVEEMCDNVHSQSDERAIHLAAYVLWRVNWIHPFTDGNGRTARMLSYILLCMSLGHLLPGIMTIPEQIAANKRPYYDGLEAADEAYQSGRVDVSVLEEMLDGMLAAQLLAVHHAATGSVTRPSTLESPP